MSAIIALILIFGACVVALAAHWLCTPACGGKVGRQFRRERHSLWLIILIEAENEVLRINGARTTYASWTQWRDDLRNAQETLARLIANEPPL